MILKKFHFSSYRGGGVWEGTLQSIVPGVGYIYYSKATEAKTFNYPRIYGTQTANSRAFYPSITHQPSPRITTLSILTNILTT